MASGCSDEVYIFATEKFIKEVEYAMEDAKRDLGKYVDVSAIMKQLPPPQLPPATISAPIDDGIDEMLLVEDEIEELHMIIKVDKKLEEVYLQHRQQEFEVGHMFELTDYLWATFYPCSLTSYSAADIISIIKRFSNRVNTATESYTRKLDASAQFQKQYVSSPKLSP